MCIRDRNRAMLSEDDIFQKYIDIAFADITDFLEFGNEEVDGEFEMCIRDRSLLSEKTNMDIAEKLELLEKSKKTLDSLTIELRKRGYAKAIAEREYRICLLYTSKHLLI